MPPQTSEDLSFAASLAQDTTPEVHSKDSAASEDFTQSAVITDTQAAKKKHQGGGNATWWVNGAFVIFMHIAGALALFFYPPQTTFFALLPWLIYLPSGLGITAGYHRLWSHRAYDGALVLKVLLAFLGTSCFQGSIRWWVVRHRLHHRFTDTDDDPYTVKKGFFFAHMGWIFEKPHYSKMKLIDTTDLDADSVVRFQHKYYVPLALFVGFGLPTIAGLIYGDLLSYIIYGGILPRLILWHCTFSINSVAHWFGEKEFAADITARGNMICSFFTFGEGYHNFHHAFPRDYRNGIYWYDFDPSKWLILVSSYLGIAYNLAVSDPNEIEKARLEVLQQHLDSKRKNLKWGPDPNTLPVLTFEEFEQQVKEQKLEQFVVDGFVVDVKGFKSVHPGGEKILKAFYGKDATNAFHGGLNLHTAAACNMISMHHVARISSAKKNQ